MMYPYEQLDEMFNDLPEQAQDFIMSLKVQDTTDYMLSNYELTVNPEDFKRAVFTVLVGKWSTEDFRDYTINELHVSEDDADDMLLDLDSILEPLWDIVEKTSTLPAQATTAVPPTPAPVPPAPASFQNPTEKVLPNKEEIIKEVEQPETYEEHPVPLIPKEPLPPANLPSQPVSPQKSEPVIILSKQQTSPLSQNQPMTNIPKQPESSGPQSILDSRLNSQTNLPKQEFNLKSSEKKNYGNGDPYREPPAA